MRNTLWVSEDAEGSLVEISGEHSYYSLMRLFKKNSKGSLWSLIQHADTIATMAWVFSGVGKTETIPINLSLVTRGENLLSVDMERVE